MDLIIQTQKQEFINLKSAVLYYLNYQSQTAQELWRSTSSKYPYGEITPASFQVALSDLINSGYVTFNGSRLATS